VVEAIYRPESFLAPSPILPWERVGERVAAPRAGGIRHPLSHRRMGEGEKCAAQLTEQSENEGDEALKSNSECVVSLELRRPKSWFSGLAALESLKCGLHRLECGGRIVYFDHDAVILPAGQLDDHDLVAASSHVPE